LEELLRALEVLGRAIEQGQPLPANAIAVLAQVPTVAELRDTIAFLEGLCELRHRFELHRALNEMVTLAAFRWSTRTRRALSRGGIVNIGQLLERSARDLLELKNFGQRALDEVRWHLSQHGLYLRGEAPAPPRIWRPGDDKRGPAAEK
jgi:hypothetical protein